MYAQTIAQQMYDPGNNIGGNHRVQPISSLTPFIGTRWCLRARVTDKGDIRHWNKGSSSGKLASLTLIDESGSIRATMFNNAVDMFNSLLTPGVVFYISNGSVKNANRRFNNVSNDYEVTLDESTQVEVCHATNAIPENRYNFVFIEIMPVREANSVCDVLGVITHVGEVSNIIQKSTNKPLARRTVKIADLTASVDLTLWDEHAQSLHVPVGTVVAIKNVRIGTYDGCSLSTTFSSSFDFNAINHIPEAKAIQDKFRVSGDVVKSVSQRSSGGDFIGGEHTGFRGPKFLTDFQPERIGSNEKPDTVDLRCTPFYVRADNVFYEACSNCNKKIIPDPNGGDPFCEKCSRNVTKVPRYMTSMHVSDGVSTAWVTLFNEAGEQFFGYTARRLQELMNINENFLSQHLQTILFRPVLMRIRVKEESGADSGMEDRLRLTATKVSFIGTELGSVVKDSDVQSSNMRTFAEECNRIAVALEAYE